VLGSVDSGYKTGLLADETAIISLPLAGDPGRFIDDDMVVRRFCCPGCAVLMATDVVQSGEGITEELVLSPWSANVSSC
jgi:N-methylhydantoinase B